MGIATATVTAGAEGLLREDCGQDGAATRGRPLAAAAEARAGYLLFDMAAILCISL